MKATLLRMLGAVLLLATGAVGSAIAPDASILGSAEFPQPIILSTDMGNEIDDQWVLLHLLAQPRIKILGIISAYAPFENIPGPPATIGAIALHQIIEDRLGLREHAPIFAGSDKPMSDDGIAPETEGARFIIDQSKGYRSRPGSCCG